jgi:hypothetical protein
MGSIGIGLLCAISSRDNWCSLEGCHTPALGGGSACAARQIASEGRRVVLVDVEHPHRVCRKTVEIGRFLTLRPDSRPHRFRSPEPASPNWKIERYPRKAALAAMPKWHGLRGSSNSRARGGCDALVRSWVV